jgi:hypothetical protein
MDDTVAARNAVRDAVRDDIAVGRVTTSASRIRAQTGHQAKADSLRYLRPGAIWSALPARDQHLLLWLLAADIVTAQLAALLVYGQLRIAQRRLARLSEYGLVKGFWAAGAQRPRGRHAFVLAPAARVEIERLAWPDGRPRRVPELPPSSPLHQLATHDLFAAFLHAAKTLVSEGVFAWIPERACADLFGGYLRPDAIAGIRVGDRAIALFIERDLGTERGEVLAAKIRRYRSVLGRSGELPIHVGFVVGSGRRARTIHDLIRRGAVQGAGVSFLTAVGGELETDPLGSTWSDGRESVPTGSLRAYSDDTSSPILLPGCLADPDALPALDDRAASMLPVLTAYLRSADK